MKDLEQPPTASISSKEDYEKSTKNEDIIENNKPKKNFSIVLNRYDFFNIILLLALFISISFSIYSHFHFKNQLKEIKDNFISSIKNLETQMICFKKELNKSIEYNYNINNEMKETKLNDIKNEIKKEMTNYMYNINNTLIYCSNNINNTLTNYSYHLNISFIKGMIIAWFGKINEIPKNWTICDGKNGTPDLRNRFIIGSSDDIKFGKTGGKSNITLSKSNLPPIGNGNISCDSHYGTWHHTSNGFIKYKGYYGPNIKLGDYDDWGSNYMIDLNEGMEASPIDIMNPFFSLYYIMKL